MPALRWPSLAAATEARARTSRRGAGVFATDAGSERMTPRVSTRAICCWPATCCPARRSMSNRLDHRGPAGREPRSTRSATSSSRRRWRWPPHRQSSIAITLSVIGGAFKAIATQMAQVLYRMSYSSIIRESEDLGCGIFFPDGAELCESDTTPMHVGSIPGYLRGSSRCRRRRPRGRRLPPQRPVPGRLAHAGPVRGDPDLPRRPASARGRARTATWQTSAGCRRA